jgi:hypothetical protein
VTQPVPTEPPQQTPPPGSGVDAVAGVTAGTAVATTAPVAAAGLSAAVAGKIAAQVVAAMGKFLTKRKRDDYVFVMSLLRHNYPEWTETQLSELAREEMRREAEFRRKVIQRLQPGHPGGVEAEGSGAAGGSGAGDPRSREAVSRDAPGGDGFAGGRSG